MLVAVPVSRDDLWAMVCGTGFPHTAVEGFAANNELAATFGVELGEEIEMAALQMADVAGLVAGRTERLVLVVEVAASRIVASPDDMANGAVEVSNLAAADCRAFFTGRVDGAISKAVAGLDIDDAWELPSVQKLLADQPLEWHDISELDAWIGLPTVHLVVTPQEGAS